MSEDDLQNRARRIAVVAVHGVGDHPKFATAREIGNLLSNLRQPSGSSRYIPFTEVIKRIKVRPVVVRDTDKFNWTDPKLQKNTWGPMDALAKSHWGTSGKDAGETNRDNSDQDNCVHNLDHQFMAGQLNEYKAEHPEDTYQCLRLEGKRIAQSNPSVGGRCNGASQSTEDKIVHVYEMYWADLSRLGNAFTRIFSELYQLLFHLGSVSVNNVLAAAIHFQSHSAGRRWRRFARAQRFTAAVLAWPIPILNLIMAAVVPAILLVSLLHAQLYADKHEFIALDVLGALLFIALSGYVILRSNFGSPWYQAPLIVFVALACVLGAIVTNMNRDLTEVIFAAIILGLVLVVVWQMVKAYNRRRPGSKRAAVILAGLVTAAVVVCFISLGFPIGHYPTTEYSSIQACLNILEITFAFLTISWGLFYFGMLWSHIEGWRAVRAVRRKDGKGAEYETAKRTRWTAQLVLALTSMVFLVLTIALWTGIANTTISALPGQKPTDSNVSSNAGQLGKKSAGSASSVPPVQYEPVSEAVYNAIRDKVPVPLLNLVNSAVAKIFVNTATQKEAQLTLVSKWKDKMFEAAGIELLPIFLVSFLIVLLIAIWALAPSAWTELWPPDSAQGRSLSCESVSMGCWLDRGFRFLRWGGEVLYWTMLLAPLLSMWLILRPEPDLVKLDDVVGALVVGTAVGVIGFAGRLKKLSGGFRPALRVMLDVDNWLREHPRDSNPTARICGRYVSLLRHISAWRDSDGTSGYDAIVVIAHSQGTVITADFLRFLHAESRRAGSMREYDPELESFGKMLITFFTMGCPLYQLYGLRFPYLYGWARNNLRDGFQPGGGPDISSSEVPLPGSLRVSQWINAYRSGDYIGRYLWRGGNGTYRWEPGEIYREDQLGSKPGNVSVDQSAKRVEYCIGSGAHTHYWDHTADLIAEQLDDIIDHA